MPVGCAVTSAFFHQSNVGRLAHRQPPMAQTLVLPTLLAFKLSWEWRVPRRQIRSRWLLLMLRQVRLCLPLQIFFHLLRSMPLLILIYFLFLTPNQILFAPPEVRVALHLSSFLHALLDHVNHFLLLLFRIVGIISRLWLL